MIRMMNYFKFSIIGFLLLFAACKTTSKVQLPVATKHQLSVELKSDKEYILTNDMQVSTKVLMPGMDAMEQNQSTYTESTMKVVEADGGDKLITTTIDSIEMNFSAMPGAETPPTPDVTDWRIYQRVTSDNTMHLDSTSGMEPAYQQMVEQMIAGTMNSYNLDIPKEGMAINDTFLQIIPFEMEMLGGMGQMTMDIKTKYTLTRVNTNDAFFNTSIDIKGIMDMMGETSDIVGEGTGTSILDRAGEYIKEANNVISQNIEMKMMGQSMETSTTTTTFAKVRMKDLN